MYLPLIFSIALMVAFGLSPALSWAQDSGPKVLEEFDPRTRLPAPAAPPVQPPGPAPVQAPEPAAAAPPAPPPAATVPPPAPATSRPSLLEESDPRSRNPLGLDWRGQEKQVVIPARLPAPRSQEWLDKFRRLLQLEQLSQAQYLADRQAWQVQEPFQEVLDQKAVFLDWLQRLSAAYGQPVDRPELQLKKAPGVLLAYAAARDTEAELAALAGWLKVNAWDPDSARVLNVIAQYTRRHQTMFDHAWRLQQKRPAPDRNPDTVKNLPELRPAAAPPRGEQEN